MQTQTRKCEDSSRNSQYSGDRPQVNFEAQYYIPLHLPKFRGFASKLEFLSRFRTCFENFSILQIPVYSYSEKEIKKKNPSYGIR